MIKSCCCKPSRISMLTDEWLDEPSDMGGKHAHNCKLLFLVLVLADELHRFDIT